jgi:thiol-disulfide isomerase/thioredoxin
MKGNPLKKTWILLGLLPIVAACLYVFDDSKSENTFSAITAGKIGTLGDSGQEFVYVYSEDCSACDVYTPILNQAMKETKKMIYKIDYLNTENTNFLEEHNVYSTPTILVIDKGKIVNRYEGARELSETIKIIQ